MVLIAFLCGLGMVGGGVFLILQENVTLGALAVLAGLGLLGFGAWVLSRERGHAHKAEETEHSAS
jgi:hypothetical protein